MLSKTCEYGSNALLFISQKSHTGRVGVKEIAHTIDSPEPFIAKILHDLARKGLVLSAKGLLVEAFRSTNLTRHFTGFSVAHTHITMNGIIYFLLWAACMRMFYNVPLMIGSKLRGLMWIEVSHLLKQSYT